jgi:putative flippase GtrA
MRAHERKVSQVRFARGLYEQFRHLIHEVAKFGAVGAVGFVVTFAGTAALDKAGLGIILSSVIATIIATFVTYFGNRYWTFRHRERTGMTRETVVFFVLNGVGILIQEAVILFSEHMLGLHGPVADYSALFVGVVFGTVFRFWSYRKWVWRGSSRPAGALAGSAPADSAHSGPVPPGPAPFGSMSGRPEDLEPETVPPAPLPDRLDGTARAAGGGGRHAAGRLR